MTPRDPAYYAHPAQAPTRDAATRAAIAAYRAHRADPLFAERPTREEVRLCAEYCQEYIYSPLLRHPAQELAVLRLTVERILTLDDLADWLWDCRRIGVEPL